MAALIAHAFDVPLRHWRLALDEIRPVAAAPSIGEAIHAVAVAKSERALRRALAELSALVNRAAHPRTKRGQRSNLLAQLVLVLEMHAQLGLEPAADLRATRQRLNKLLSA